MSSSSSALRPKTELRSFADTDTGAELPPKRAKLDEELSHSDGGENQGSPPPLARTFAQRFINPSPDAPNTIASCNRFASTVHDNKQGVAFRFVIIDIGSQTPWRGKTPGSTSFVTGMVLGDDTFVLTPSLQDKPLPYSDAIPPFTTDARHCRGTPGVCTTKRTRDEEDDPEKDGMIYSRFQIGLGSIITIQAMVFGDVKLKAQHVVEVSRVTLSYYKKNTQAPPGRGFNVAVKGSIGLVGTPVDNSDIYHMAIRSLYGCRYPSPEELKRTHVANHEHLIDFPPTKEYDSVLRTLGRPVFVGRCTAD
jgi:hypothetical protein